MSLTVLVAVLAAASSFTVNRLLIYGVGNSTVFTLSPLVEELSKTLLAVAVGANVLITHCLFGLIEAVYDWRQAAANGHRAALASIIGHSLFGWLTVVAIDLVGEVIVGLAAGIAAHLTWNVVVTKIQRR